MVRQDLLSRFTHLSTIGEEKLTDKTLRDIILNFIIAGRDTSAVTLTWFFYMMSCHPEVADKVFEEACSIEQPNSGAQGRILHQYVAFCTTSADWFNTHCGIFHCQFLACLKFLTFLEMKLSNDTLMQKLILMKRDDFVDLVEEAQFEAFAKLLTFETLGKMAYLQAALSETLRLFPAVPLVLVSILLSFLWYQVVSFHMSFAST
jgi:cytochrome P450